MKRDLKDCTFIIPIKIESTDRDGSETITGTVTIKALSGGEFTLNGVDITSNGEITIDATQLANVKFVPDSYTHGDFDFELELKTVCAGVAVVVLRWFVFWRNGGGRECQ